MSRWHPKSMLERFEEKFVPVTESGCWLWTAARHGRGYGLFHTGRGLRKGKMEFAHRISYELYRGIQPEADEVVCHSCDVPDCVNPNHLFLGTQKDNMEDMKSKKRAKNGKLRLSEQEVRAILKSEGRLKDIANEFGIYVGYCSRLRAGKVKHWKHLVEEVTID